MGHMYITASKSVVPYGSARATRPISITSVVASPLSEAAVSAKVTLYDATAATANTEILSFICGTAPRTITWSDFNGIEVKNLYVAVGSAFATVVWR